jgi:RNA polymerase sigma factor (sigma-70 family)
VNIKDLDNVELIRLCAQESSNRNAWIEFYNRFDERIWLVIYRESEKMGFTKEDSQFQNTLKDLVQEVYLKLVANDCKALKNFTGASVNSIYTYLGVIAKNVVKNHVISINAQKRSLPEKSLDEVLTITENGQKIYTKDVIKSPDSDIEDELSVTILKEEIDSILDNILKNKDKDRNKLIFKLCFYEGFSPEEIASQFGFGLSSKRISNLTTEIKNKLRQELFG